MSHNPGPVNRRRNPISRRRNLCSRHPLVLRADETKIKAKLLDLWKRSRPFVVRADRSVRSLGVKEFLEKVADVCDVFGVRRLDVRVGTKNGAVGNRSEIVPMSVDQFCASTDIPSLYAAQNTIFKHEVIQDVRNRRSKLERRVVKESNRQRLGAFIGSLTGLDQYDSKNATTPHVLSKMVLEHLKVWKSELREANIWLNHNEVSSQVHYDLYDNLLGLVTGCKRVLLLPPDTKQVVSSDSGNYHEGKFVRKRNKKLTLRKVMEKESRAMICFLRTGDVLRIPEGWYHFVSSAPGSIAINIWYKSVLESMPKIPILRHLIEEQLHLIKDQILVDYIPDLSQLSLWKKYKILIDGIPTFMQLLSQGLSHSENDSLVEISEAEFKIAAFLKEVEKADQANDGEIDNPLRSAFLEAFTEQFTDLERRFSIKNERKIRSFLGKRSIDSLFHQI